MENGKSSLGMLRFALYFIASAIAIVPISSVAWGYIIGPQEIRETPVVATQEARVAPITSITAGVAQLEPTIQEVAPPTATEPNADPFARRRVKWPFANANGFVADPMNSFVEKIRDAKDEEEKEKAIEQTKAALGKHYDRYVDGFEKQVDEMEERLGALRDQLDKRKDAKDRLVGLRLEMLTSQAEGLGWPGGYSRAPVPGQRSNSQTPWRTNLLKGQSRLVRPTAFSNFPQPTVAFGPPAAPQIAGVPSNVLSPRRPPGVPSVAQNSMLAVPGAPVLPPPYVQVASNQPVSFAGYFGVGIELLEDGKYGEFLDRFLEPAAFRKSLKSATLDQASEDFENKDADRILGYFQSAIENPVKRVGPTTTKLTWKIEAEDGSTHAFSLNRIGGGEFGKWCMSIKVVVR